MPNSQCINTVESYTCVCRPGYTGSGDTLCDGMELFLITIINIIIFIFFIFILFKPDINECSLGYCDTNSDCVNTPGNYTCSDCHTGYNGTGYTRCDGIILM